MKRKILKKTITIFLFCFLLVISSPKQILANGFNITAMPARFEIMANTEENISKTVIIKNNSKEILYLDISKKDLLFDEKTKLFKSIESDNSSSSLASWIEIEKVDLKLNPKETKEINFKINIPKEIESGKKYASLNFGQNKSQRQLIQGGLAVLIVLDISSPNGQEEKVIEKIEEKAGESNFNRLLIPVYISFIVLLILFLLIRKIKTSHILPRKNKLSSRILETQMNLRKQNSKISLPSKKRKK